MKLYGHLQLFTVSIDFFLLFTCLHDELGDESLPGKNLWWGDKPFPGVI
jgi:hypothetical protein